MLDNSVLPAAPVHLKTEFYAKRPNHHPKNRHTAFLPANAVAYTLKTGPKAVILHPVRGAT